MIFKNVLSSIVIALALAAAASTGQPAAQKVPPELVWTCELAPWSQIDSKAGPLSRLMGNALVPTFLSGMAQRRFTKMFGPARTADPLRWAAFDTHEGDFLTVVLVYPSVDREAKMVFNHAGAKHDPEPGVIILPPGEGREYRTFAVFNADRTYCAFSESRWLAKRALAAKYPSSDGKLCAFLCGKTRASLAVDDDGMLVDVEGSDPAELNDLKSIPVAGGFFTAPGKRRVKGGSAVREAVLSLGRVADGRGAKGVR